MNNIIQFKPKEDTMKDFYIKCGKLYIKGVVSKDVMHRATITPEIKQKLKEIKKLIRNRINKG